MFQNDAANSIARSFKLVSLNHPQGGYPGIVWDFEIGI